MNNVSGKLNQQEWREWVNNFLRFGVAPVGIVYLTSTLGILQLPHHLITLQDFIPNQYVIGGMVVSVFNSALDLLLKVRQGN
jgi:hypothetical protein